MICVVLTERGGEPQRLRFDKDEIAVGRVQGNDIVLPKANVSKRHCRITVRDGRVVATDLQSTNGTYVNGRKIASPQPVRGSDRIYVGDFVLQVSPDAEEASSGPKTLERGAPTMPEGQRTQPARGGSSLEEAEPMPTVQTLTSLGIEIPRITLVGPTGADGTLAGDPTPEATPAVQAEAARVTLVGPTGGHSTLVGQRSPTPADEPSRAPALVATLIAPGGAPPPPAAERDTPPTVAEPEERRTTAPMAAVQSARRPTAPLAPVERTTGPHATAEGLAALGREVSDRVLDSADLRLIEGERLSEAALRARAEQAIAAVIRDMSVPNSMDRLILGRHVLREVVGLGALEAPLADVEVSEILVDRADRIQVVRAGRREPQSETFSSERTLQRVVDRLLFAAGARPEQGPLFDLRLSDGLRATVVLPPLAVRGPALCIRKRRRQDLTLDELVVAGSLSSAMADLLWACVMARRSVLFCGGPGSGKTTLLSATAAFVPADERVICVEDVEEIQGTDAWLRLECRPPGVDKPAPQRDLVRSALRMRPDRLIVGDVFGGEALDVLQAMRTGLCGSLATLHAISPRDGLSRLANLAREADPGLAPLAARRLVASAVDLVVHGGRFADGKRCVTQMSEVDMDGDEIELRDVFVFTPQGEGSHGSFTATGLVPTFLASQPNELVDESIFRPA
jgi:pilus assembly protein CpaF